MDTLLIEHSRWQHHAPGQHDRELTSQIENRLRNSGYSILGAIACDTRNRVAYLCGHLPSYYLKQVAQAVAAEVEDVRRVVNRIEVTAPARMVRVGCNCATSHCDDLN